MYDRNFRKIFNGVIAIVFLVAAGWFFQVRLNTSVGGRILGDTTRSGSTTTSRESSSSSDSSRSSSSDDD